ncbi:hypothetical protein [Chromobacterium haemolyticum]|uniref:hypothetical protein n=1 Tax=Chromobacterium haemolyticum TaxID=394935 RepID=UPI00307EB5B7
MITKEQLTELHAAAEAAHRPGVFWYQQDMLERFTRHFTGAELDAAYIAAASPATVLALFALIAELQQDAARLDSGCIRTLERDDFGEEQYCIRNGINLRAAIDAAMSTQAATERP